MKVKTKVGDWVCVCFNTLRFERLPLLGAELSEPCQVINVHGGLISVAGCGWVRSWIRLRPPPPPES